METFVDILAISVKLPQVSMTCISELISELASDMGVEFINRGQRYHYCRNTRHIATQISHRI